MHRRFINLVLKDFSVGDSYWLSRLAPEEKLFYSSATEAAAAQEKARRETLQAIRPSGSTLDLRPPEFRFRSSHSDDPRLDFMPLYGRRGGEGKIVVTDSIGQTGLYDADPGSMEMLPRLNAPKWHSPISLCVADGALYAINRANSSNFKALARPPQRPLWPRPRPHGKEEEAWSWLDLPPPPYLDAPCRSTIHSYTLLEDGKTICFSSAPGRKGGFGTYCFNTSGHVWTKGGDASATALPFIGRALHVPELHNLFFGFLDSNPHTLCAAELPSADQDGITAPPKVLHKWRGFLSPPMPSWSLMSSSLLYLGSRRFCVAKQFHICNGALACILTGVEVVNAEENKSKLRLRMIKHKCRDYIFEGCGIESVF